MNHAHKTFQTIFVVPAAVHLLDLAGPAQIFYEAKSHGAEEIAIRFVSAEARKTEVQSSAGLYFTRLESYTDLDLRQADLIFVPGIESSVLFDDEFTQGMRPFLQWLSEQHRRGVGVCSICTGAFLLAEAGILAGRDCTTHWRYLDRFTEKYPDARLQTNRLFVDSGSVCTSAGVASGIDLALYLLEKKRGSFFTVQIARESVVYARRTESDPQMSVFLQYRNHIDDVVHKTQDFLSQSFCKGPTLEEIAGRMHVSPRNLTRLFKKTTGITIGQYMNKLRVEHAIKLASDGNKVTMVASECGVSPNQLRNLLKKHEGVLPTDLRALA